MKQTVIGKSNLRIAAVRAACSLLFLAVLAVSAMLCGRYPVSPAELFDVLTGQSGTSQMLQNVVLNMRLPRVCFALAAGGGLAAAGAAMQGVFANPLATPDTLGVANGASFGAALGILLGQSSFGIQMMAMCCGLLAVFAVFLLAGKKQGNPVLMLVLAGMAVGSFFSALLALVKYVADPQSVLPNITYWLMGSLNAVTWRTVRTAIGWIAAGTGMIWLLRWKLNALSLSEEEARALGIPVGRLRVLLVGAASMSTAAIVAACGQIGWIGLLIPHCCRLAFGGDYRKTMWISICFGGAFLLVVDTAARSLTAAEIPAAILTSFFGAPLFLILMKREGRHGR